MIAVGNKIKKLKNKGDIEWQTWTLHQRSSISKYYVVKLEKYLLYIDQLYHFMKIINLSRIEIPPPP